MDEYQHRVIDDEVDELLDGLAVVAIEGPKAVGKTETARRRARTEHRLDDPTQLALAEADPARLLTGEAPILIDEWQRFPASWDLVRRAVDDGAPTGTAILTGSAAPTTHPTHSGAGRIPTIRMRPMSFAERHPASPTVSLGALLTGTHGLINGTTTVTLAGYTDEIVHSGFPGIRDLTPRVLRTQLDGYLARIVDRDFDELGQRVRRPNTLRRWMTAYAAAVSTTTTLERIRDAATGTRGNPPARTTIDTYREVLEQLWIIDPIPAWTPTQNNLARLGQSPKHQLADPALAARLLNTTTRQLLSGDEPGPTIPRNGPLLGALFESLATLSIRVYAQGAEATVGHLRTHRGDHEIDLIVESTNGAVVAIEIKLARTINDNDTRHLHWLRNQIGDNLADAVIITTGPDAYRRHDGIAVVPLALLGP